MIRKKRAKDRNAVLFLAWEDQYIWSEKAESRLTPTIAVLGRYTVTFCLISKRNNRIIILGVAVSSEELKSESDDWLIMYLRHEGRTESHEQQFFVK